LPTAARRELICRRDKLQPERRTNAAALKDCGETPMRILVTGSAGHLGEALVRALRARGDEPIGVDIRASDFTTHVGSIADRTFVRSHMRGVEGVLHAATLHKPHVETHGREEFIDTNITGTLNLLEEAAAAGVASFVFTSTTSVFGNALAPSPGAPAAWIDESVASVPKNIYGVTKAAAEDLCQIFHRNRKLPCIVLRTSRFFPEADDDGAVRAAWSDDNVKANEYLYRRVAIEDVVSAHLLALTQAPPLGFGKYIISATTPFLREDLAELRVDAPAVLGRRAPEYEDIYGSRGWKMFPSIGRVYCNNKARRELTWKPRYDFAHIMERLAAGQGVATPLAALIGAKGYHTGKYSEEMYPVEPLLPAPRGEGGREAAG
jgi:UDP-glucose 4-epimerase